MKQQVRIYRPGPPGVEILHVRNVSGPIPKHVHASWCLALVERGERTITTSGLELRLNPGDAALIPPGMAHACVSPSEGCDFQAVSIRADLVPGIARQIRKIPGSMLPDPIKRALRGNDRAAVRLLLDYLPLVMPDISNLAACRKEPSRPAPAVLKALCILDGPDAAELSLADLARRTGTSPFHLSRLFTKGTGLPPNEHRTLSRLRQARALLAQGTPQAETAASCGFYDQSHLTLRFKKYMGMTPGQFARACR